jgi:hypothetical protein
LRLPAEHTRRPGAVAAPLRSSHAAREAGRSPQKIEAGEQIRFDEASLSELAQQIRAGPDFTRKPIGCTIASWTLVAIMILLALYVFAC